MNPVQLKVSSVENVKTEVKGMTVFNTEQVDTKKQPMFFGRPLGVQRYDSYKYPIFDKLTTQQLGYFSNKAGRTIRSRIFSVKASTKL